MTTHSGRTHFGPCRFAPVATSAEARFPRPCEIEGCPMVREGLGFTESKGAR